MTRSKFSAALEDADVMDNLRGHIIVNATGTVNLNNRSILDAAGGGSITIYTRNLNMAGASELIASLMGNTNSANSQGGDIVINAIGEITLRGNSRIRNEVDRTSAGSGGSIHIAASHLFLDGAETRVSTTFNSNQESCSNQCHAGDINLQIGTLHVTNPESTTSQGAGFLSNTNGIGNAGSIRIEADGDVRFENRGTLNSSVGNQARGNGGSIEIDAASLTLRNDGLFLANTLGRGNTGSISIRTRGDVNLIDGSRFQVNVGNRNANTSVGVGNGGEITIEAQSVSLEGSFIEAVTNAEGSAGTIRIHATDSIVLSDFDRPNNPPPNNLPIRSRITTATAENGGGPSGDIIISANSLQILDGSAINAQSGSQYRGGNITIDVEQLRAIGGGQIVTTAYSEGDAGNITINAENITLSGNNPDFPSILQSARNRVGTEIPNIFRVISTDVNGFLATNNGSSGLFARTSDSGAAGNITVNTSQLTVQSGARVSAETSEVGRGGNIALRPNENGQTLTVNFNDGRISGSTSARGQGGSLIIQSPEAVILQGNGQLTVETTGVGQAGNVEISTPQLNVREGARISATATATATAQGGSITVASDRLNIFGANSGLFAETQGAARAGNFILQPNSSRNLIVRFQDGAQISASTSGSGRGGNLRVTAPESITLSGNGSLVAQSSGDGSAGTLRLNTGQLTIQNQAQASVSSTGSGAAGNLQVTARDVLLNNQAGLTAETGATRTGGDIQLRVSDSVRLFNSSQISASTVSGQGGDIVLRGLNSLEIQDSQIGASANTGQAGTVTVDVADSIRLANGSIRVGATGQNGIAGDLRINTNQFIAQDQSQVTVSSEQGRAGNLSINARSLRLDNGSLTAVTGAGNGGNITLQGLNQLFLNNGSLVSAEALNRATGGNIRIDSSGGYIIAAPFENSDIIANAVQGRGGEIQISANRVFGMEIQNGFSTEVLRSNDTSDISASSEAGPQGIVTIDAIDVDPSRGLAELPTDIVDASRQVSRGCRGSGITEEALGEFVITGRGGLPPNPTDVLSHSVDPPDLITLNSNEEPTEVPASSDMSSSSSSITEAQGWRVGANGGEFDGHPRTMGALPRPNGVAIWRVRLQRFDARSLP